LADIVTIISLKGYCVMSSARHVTHYK